MTLINLTNYFCSGASKSTSNSNNPSNGNMGPTGNGSGNGKAVTSVLNAAQSAQRREDIRLTKMMLTIFLCFLVCFLPLMLVNVADDAVEFPFLHILASVLAWASAVVNPFIYAFKNRQYQQAFIKVSFVKKNLSTLSSTFLQCCQLRHFQICKVGITGVLHADFVLTKNISTVYSGIGR